MVRLCHCGGNKPPPKPPGLINIKNLAQESNPGFYSAQTSPKKVVKINLIVIVVIAKQYNNNCITDFGSP